MTITHVSTGCKKTKNGFEPCIYVYENYKFLWKQSEPIHFVNREDADAYAIRMKQELLEMNLINSKAVA